MMDLSKQLADPTYEYLKSLDKKRRLFYPLSSAETFTQGEEGVNRLNTWLTQPWGFHIADIDPTISVDIYASYGDEMVPLTMADHIAKQLQRRQRNSSIHSNHHQRRRNTIGMMTMNVIQVLLGTE